MQFGGISFLVVRTGKKREFCIAARIHKNRGSDRLRLGVDLERFNHRSIRRDGSQCRIENNGEVFFLSAEPGALEREKLRFLYKYVHAVHSHRPHCGLGLEKSFGEFQGEATIGWMRNHISADQVKPANTVNEALRDIAAQLAPSNDQQRIQPLSCASDSGRHACGTTSHNDSIIVRFRGSLFLSLHDDIRCCSGEAPAY